MISPKLRLTITALGLATAVNANWAADDARSRPDASKAGPTSTAQRTSTTRSPSGKGPLPDPALLDGSTQQAEKKSEHGMIGEFELPGDENVRSGKVGGPQNQTPPMAGGGGQQNNMPAGMPKSGGGGGPQGAQQPQGGAQAAQQQGGAQAGGAQGGPQNPNAAGNPVAGGGDPGAQPQGVQVAELGGEASAQGGAGAGGPGDKPPPVAIGDSAMRIEQSANVASAVGAQQQQVPGGHTQQHEKGTGSGGKGSGGSQGGNRVEKGRTIPAGL